MTPSVGSFDRAVEIIERARAPFVYGLAASPVGTARLAARLAARIDAAIDIEGGDRLAAEIEAIATTGQVTATFGEMRAAADCVVLWRADPRREHPDLLAGDSRHGPRRFIFVPPAPGPGGDSVAAEPGDFVLPIPPGRDLETLQRLRFLLNTGGPGADAGVDAAPDEIWEAAAIILASHRVVILWDTARVGSQAGPLAAGFALLTLDPRRLPRIAAKAIGVPGHVAGAMAGLLAATGFPRAVAFRGGEPRCDPLRFGADRMFSGAADLIVAIEPCAGPPGPLSVPLVLIGSRLPPGWPEPEVFLPIAASAPGGEGVWLGADGVPVPRSAQEQPAPAASTAPVTATEVLTSLLQRLPTGRRRPSP
jgi:formylmethanofuran dehydrogenase subunit B